MLDNRISTQAMYRNAYQNVSGLQKEVNKLNKKISGEKYNSFSDVRNKGDIKGLIDLSSDYAYAEAYIDSGKMAINKLDQMEYIVTSVIKVIQDLKHDVIMVDNGVMHDVAPVLSANAESQLHYVSSLLNFNSSGDYILSGSRINLLPVINMEVPNFDEENGRIEVLSGKVNSKYYRGDNQEKSVIIGDNITLKYGVNAGDKGFQEAVAALHIIHEANKAGGKMSDYFERSLSLIESSMEKLSELRIKIMGDRVKAEKMVTYNEDLKVGLIERQEIIDSNNGNNLVELMVQFGQVDNALNAAMHTYVQSTKLNLLNHIK